jgi:hypothetical protein
MCGLYPVLQLGVECAEPAAVSAPVSTKLRPLYVSSVCVLCCLQERREASGSSGCCSKPCCSQFSLRSCVPGSKAAATADVESGCTTATPAVAGGQDTDVFTAAADQAAKGRSSKDAVSADAHAAVDPLAAPSVSPMMLPGATCKSGSTASSVDGSVTMCDCCCEGVPPAQPLEIPPQVRQSSCSCSDPGAPGSCHTATVHASAGLSSHPCCGDLCLITFLILHCAALCVLAGEPAAGGHDCARLPCCCFVQASCLLLILHCAISICSYVFLQENQQLAATIASDPHAADLCSVSTRLSLIMLLHTCLQENQQLAAMIASDPHAAVLCKPLACC